ncbi:Ran GTPase activator [Kockovaella imperatae]|uniref:Ran GTPase activator n=1 Tax=Kockovaella imperatae TaxID=4999 RepID=A0A1Y1UQ31_9TREE|nr:Ran GTPase activator [Kockovaella imperatae]ORX40082.1 Ran GTPase activator [Kockovaella imperatae]
MSEPVASTSSSKVFSILGKNLKANTAEELEPYLTQLKDLDGVEEVHLGGNSLGVEACQAIAEVLKTKKTLKVVDLADIFTGRLISEIPQAVSALCDSLTDHTSLVEIDLSDNAFGGRCADSLTNFLRSNTSFSIFKLNNNGLGPMGGEVIAKAVSENADKCRQEGKESSLRTIVCGRNRLENGSADAWAEAFEKHGKLREIKMPQNGIRMEGIASLAKGLSKNPDLELLDLQDNTATKTGTRSIVKQLSKWPNLRHLNLSDCLLGSSGGIALAKSLSLGSNPKMEELKLQYGEFDKRTVELLTEAIAQHLKDLKVLELNGNRFSEDDDCVEELKKALALHGNEDALDELDDMEEVDEDEEEEESEEEAKSESEKEDEDKAGEPLDGVAKGEETDFLPATTVKATDE